MVDFKPNLFDRALAVIAPTTATRRLAARVAFGNLVRVYAGQSQGRLSGDWRALDVCRCRGGRCRDDAARPHARSGQE